MNTNTIDKTEVTDREVATLKEVAALYEQSVKLYDEGNSLDAALADGQPFSPRSRLLIGQAIDLRATAQGLMEAILPFRKVEVPQSAKMSDLMPVIRQFWQAEYVPESAKYVPAVDREARDADLARRATNHIQHSRWLYQVAKLMGELGLQREAASISEEAGYLHDLADDLYDCARVFKPMYLVFKSADQAV
jgi:hypothetical protein